MRVQFDSIMEKGLVQREATFLPLQLAIKYYKKWDCDVSCYVEDSIYYKCLSGNGTVHFLNGNSYTGAFLNGFMHGKGIYNWKSGLTYEGQLQHNAITGQGRLRWPDGSYYIGSVFQGARHGFGEYYCAIDRSTYKGAWIQGLKNGKGVLTFANGSLYEGDFKGGLREGNGKMKYPSGNEYEGEWRSDKKEGKGVMNWWSTLQKYQGEWKQDLPWGLGSYYWLEGRGQARSIKTIFKGEWRQGKRQGFGTFFYNNGCSLQGTFVNNLKEGMCLVVDEFGDAHLQTFRNDKSLLKKEDIAQKEEKKHFKLPQLAKKGEIPAVSGVLQVNQAQQNNYWKMMDFQCGLVDEPIFNLLLRENSQLRHWYRTLANNLSKEVFGGLTIEGVWRLLKDMRLTDNTITLAKLNRHFFNGNKARFQVQFGSKPRLTLLKTHSHLLTPSNYSRIEWEAFFEQARTLKVDWSDWKNGLKQGLEVERVRLGKELNVHSGDHIMLFRHFVVYLLHLALLQHEQNLSSSFRKCLEDLFASIKSALAPVSNFKTEKNCSEVMTNLSHNQAKLHISEEYLAINHGLFSELCMERGQLLGVLDETVTVRQLYCLLAHCSLLRQPAQKILFLEKIERNMNVRGSLLKKDNKAAYQALEKQLLKAPYFTHLLNYEMVQSEFHQILYVFLNRKIGNTQSKQEFLRRYKDTVTSISAAFASYSRPKRTILAFNHSRLSLKDRQKQVFLKSLERQRQRQAEQERKLRQTKRQERERLMMKRQDFDIKDEEMSEASEQYYD